VEDGVAIGGGIRASTEGTDISIIVDGGVGHGVGDDFTLGGVVGTVEVAVGIRASHGGRSEIVSTKVASEDVVVVREE